LYCSRVHGGPDGLCDRCRELEAYALERLERCPFGEEKPTCASCRVHCYKAAMREKVRSVMRYAGPRMLLRHPYLALMHLLVDSRRPTPPSRRRDR
ncbi:MAG: nitrous oxide-stimulated promoter family protein, partial [Candidatus Riflebacteria bacterium]|nr:nitrous oxide-stimulated promoter family protein [Candidatus Riflebacteria bacterium]